MVWQVISFNLRGYGGRGDRQMMKDTVAWWRFIRDNVGAVKEARFFRQVVGPNRWHYQIWLLVDGIESWDEIAAMMGPRPWTKPDPRFIEIRSRVVQVDHQDEFLEEIPLDGGDDE